MKFLSLEIEQFLALTKAKIALADRGLVLIQGINGDDTSADSNGAGKSSIADALCWVLYGVTARGVTGDDVVNNVAGKGTKVQVDIEDGHDIYRIARHRKHSKGKNGLTVLHLPPGGTISELTKGTDKLTQDVVNRIVGASYDVFKAAVYAGQEQMPDLPAMTDKHLKLLIEEASGVTLLEEAYRESRLRASAEKEKLDLVNIEVGKAADRLTWLEDSLADTMAQQRDWVTSQKARIDGAKVDLSTMVTSVKALDKVLATFDEPELTRQIAALDAKIAAVSKEQDELRAHDRTVALNTNGVGNYTRSILQLENRLDQAKKALANVSHKIGCPCDECGRPLTEAELAAATAAARTTVDVLVADIHDQTIERKDAQRSLQLAQERRDAFAATMTDVSKASALRASLFEKRAEYQRSKAERENQATRAREMGERIKKMAVEVNPHNDQVAKVQEQIKAAEAKRAELLKSSAERQNEVDLAETIVKVFSPAGVRAHILDEVTPFLNAQTAKYLGTLSDGNITATWTTLVRTGKGELREKFSIEVENDHGAKSFAGLSGGEKRKVRVATALALQDLVATRATKPVELFIGDEIDDALDTAGLERLTQILEEKAEERGSVFVISHNSLRDWISNIVQVEKKGGTTTVTELVA